MFKIYKFLFFNTLIMGTLITISSYSWFNMWIGLEINLLSMIPLMKSKNYYSTEAALKYFITQALASVVILFTIIMTLKLMDYLPHNLNFWFMMMMNSSLLTKLGAAPFHFWFPEVMEGINWTNGMILLTIQKLAPMVLLMYNFYMTFFFSFIIISSSLIGGILGLNQTSLRKIMAYSSINHISWMLSSLMTFSKIWFEYYLIYCLITMNIIMIFQMNKIFKLNQLILFFKMDKLTNLMLISNFLSLGGLPPFIGFLPKWLVINNLVENNFMSLSLILILSTLITLYFYLRIMMTSLSISFSNMSFPQMSFNQWMMITSNTITFFSLILYTTIFNLF